jgi:glutaredoxin 3|tara:strand:- start:42 stop:449 length:408 start_codon:yes stop_codon:yes gene_type:complete
VKKTILSVLVVILFAVFVQEKIVEQDIRKAIVVFNENPTFTKETIVETDFENAAVTIFTASWCGYCNGAKQLLNEKEITFFEVDVEEYNISKRKLKEIGIEDFFVPQIFVDGVPIGGFSDLKKIFGSDMPVPKVS